MRTITTIEELMEELENDGCFALRGASEHDIEVAENRDYLDCSMDMFNDDNAEYSEDKPLLNGTCGVDVNEYMSEEKIMQAYNNAMKYAYRTHVVYLISDTDSEYGNDDNEVILGHNGCGADIIAEVKIA